MNGSDQWYQDGSNAPNGTADSVRNARRLLGVYPMASATPSTHGELNTKKQRIHGLKFVQLRAIWVA